MTVVLRCLLLMPLGAGCAGAPLQPAAAPRPASQSLTAWLDSVYRAELAYSPQMQRVLGLIDDLEARRLIAKVMDVAPRFFHRLPRAPLEVRAVEPFREATATGAFYNAPSLDGSRPGYYYVNLSDMPTTPPTSWSRSPITRGARAPLPDRAGPGARGRADDAAGGVLLRVRRGVGHSTRRTLARTWASSLSAA